MVLAENLLYRYVNNEQISLRLNSKNDKGSTIWTGISCWSDASSCGSGRRSVQCNEDAEAKIQARRCQGKDPSTKMPRQRSKHEDANATVVAFRSDLLRLSRAIWETVRIFGWSLESCNSYKDIICSNINSDNSF